MVTKPLKAIGLMSGTSLDGLDICLCEFSEQEETWNFGILQAETLPYEDSWKERLTYSESLSAGQLLKLDHEYGLLLSYMLEHFLEKNNIPPLSIDLIASHGHTFYHRPEEGFTFQLGNGPELFSYTQRPVVCDFRRQDVALGGQGAPLVPIGDKMLFDKYQACVNFGGFANISFDINDERVAFDICPVNYVLNHITKKLGHEYDNMGLLASQGAINEDLLKKLNKLDYYQEDFPKSLGAEWVNQYIFPLIETAQIGELDILNTFSEHVAFQVTEVLNKHKIENCLITGGGAYNANLIRQIRNKTSCDIQLPSNEIVEYKEALIFAFMGVLRITGKNNILSTVTGASRTHSSGVIYS